MNKAFNRVVTLSGVLAFCVIVLGAFVRLSDAGLGCPDWPGCYGILVGVPDTAPAIEAANENYERAVEIGKAWKEMIHRYLAGVLGLLVFFIAAWLIRGDKEGNRQVGYGVVLALALSFQAVLGMWTVTWQLKPLVVMCHLLGGFTLFNLLGWQWLRSLSNQHQFLHRIPPGLGNFSIIVLFALVLQIALGGWVSSNYAALACTEFPRCHGSLWPQDMDLKNGFIMWRGLGVDYEFGVLDHPARLAIHMVHRAGALVVSGLILFYAWRLFRAAVDVAPLRRVSLLIVGFLTLQITLGILNVVGHLPLPIAVAHNGVALLLLFSILSSTYMLKSGRYL